MNSWPVRIYSPVSASKGMCTQKFGCVQCFICAGTKLVLPKFLVTLQGLMIFATLSLRTGSFGGWKRSGIRGRAPLFERLYGHAHFSATAYYIHLIPDLFSELSGMDLNVYGDLLPEVPHECWNRNSCKVYKQLLLYLSAETEVFQQEHSWFL